MRKSYTKNMNCNNNTGNVNNVQGTGNETYNYSEADISRIAPFFNEQVLEAFIIAHGFGSIITYLIRNQVKNMH